MHKAGLGVLKALAGGATLALGCLAVVYSVEIVAFLGNNAMWIIVALGVWTALSVVVGLTLGRMLRKPELLPPVEPAPPAAPAAPAKATGVVDIPSPTSPHGSEHGVPLNAPPRSRLTAR